MTLAGRMDGDLPIRGIGGEAGMRLDVSLMHGLRGVAALDDDLGVLEARFDVALLEGDDLGDVGRRGRLRVDPGGEQVGVQHRRIRRHRFLDVDHERQHFVLHVDQFQRLVSDQLRHCRDGGHGMAFIQHLVARHDVQRQIAEVHRAFADKRFFRSDVGEIRGGDDRAHTR